jgi:plasmid stabilization system protein ParE
MAHKIIWAPSAEKDLNEAYSNLFQKNPDFAIRWVDKLTYKIELLHRFPEMGAMIDEFNISFIREIYNEPYKLAYLVVNEEIRILKIVRLGSQFQKL